MIAQTDFAIGYRVHGILPAMANGIPGVLVSYDSRSGELAETFSIPSATAEILNAMPFEQILDPNQFKEFSARFPIDYDQFKSFLDRNRHPKQNVIDRLGTPHEIIAAQI